MLVTLTDDDEAMRIAAQVMKKIWRPLESLEHCGSSAIYRFIPLFDWFDALERVRPRFHGGTGPFREDIFQRVESWLKDAFAENHDPVLMHGDFHHYNVLSSERGWLVIDPKGVMGPAGYEVGPLLMNPWSDFLKWSNPRLVTKRRIDILHEYLGFERQRILEWGLAHAVLSAWWCIEDNIKDDHSIPFGEMIADIK
jgi:streptomycin 6-kinase